MYIPGFQIWQELPRKAIFVLRSGMCQTRAKDRGILRTFITFYCIILSIKVGKVCKNCITVNVSSTRSNPLTNFEILYFSHVIQIRVDQNAFSPIIWDYNTAVYYSRNMSEKIRGVIVHQTWYVGVSNEIFGSLLQVLPRISLVIRVVSKVGGGGGKEHGRIVAICLE